MKNRNARGLVAAWLVALGCVGCLGVEEDATILPEPDVWRLPPDELSEDARSRQAEVDRYIRDNVYRDYRIVATTQTHGGDLIDWVDPATVPGSQIEPPPPIPAEELVTPPGVELQPTELDLHPELRGPAGTIPIVRPDFSRYVRGESAETSIGEYLRAHRASGQPAGQNRLYAGYANKAANTMVVGTVANSIGQVASGTFSLIEVASSCPGWNPATTMELVGAVVSRDRIFSDGALRLQVEFFTAGGNNVDDYVGGWDGQVAGFVPAAGRPYGPNALLAQSVIGGYPQYESPFKIQNHNGNWWIAHNGNWLGYYPGYLFDLMHYQGCQTLWYGEVYDPTPTDWTWTDMGSGYFSVFGNKWAAHVRNPWYGYGSSSWWADDPIKPPVPMLPQDWACYTSTGILKGASPWDRAFYLGGPGGDAFGCN